MLILIISELQQKPSSEALVSINEREERDAQRAFYNRIDAEMSMKRMKKLEFMNRVNTVFMPIGVLTFMTLYWILGLRHAGAL